MTNELTAAEFFDREAVTYDTDWGTPEEIELYADVTYAVLDRIKPAPMERLVDIGCGTGRGGVELAKRWKCRVVMTDVADKMIEAARENVRKAGVGDRVEVVKRDICRMRDLGEGRFDMATAEGCPVSYASDPLRALQEMRALLRPGGVCMFTVHSKFWTLGWRYLNGRGAPVEEIRKFLADGRTVYHDTRYGSFALQTFAPEEIHALTRKAGFVNIRLGGKLIAYCLNFNRDEVQQMLKTRQGFEAMKHMELQLMEEPSLVGASQYLQVLCDNPG
jgi:ubiquinone/menaquinone biosynthesis C-methylase UbiE